MSKAAKKILDAVVSGEEGVADAEAAGVSKDDLEASKGLLHAVAGKGYASCVKTLLSKGADANGFRKDGWTPLACAASTGQAEVCDILLSQKARVNEGVKDTGQTPLMVAARVGALATTRFLLGAGADVNKADKDGCTALWHAVNENRRDVAKVLLEAGASPNSFRTKDKCAPLHIAVSKAFHDIIQLLMDYKADPKQAMDSPKKGEAWIPADIAKGKNDERAVQLLGAKTAVLMRKKDRGDVSPQKADPQRASGGP